MARKHPAGIFLIVIAIIAVLVGLSKILVNVYSKEAMQLAFVPKHPIAEEEMSSAPDYTFETAWAALPGQENSDFDVFFLHPTTHMKPNRWNAAFDDQSAEAMLQSVALKNMASAFGGSLYAPRYRQATTGAFYDESGQGEIAQKRAYEDILNAYDAFASKRRKNRPYVLVGHSQGGLHLLNLLKDRISKSQDRKYLVAAYILGWPVSQRHDLKAVELPACINPNDTGCVLSWMTYKSGAQTDDLKTWFHHSTGLDNKARSNDTILCTNPLTWEVNGQAKANNHLGAVIMTTGSAPLPTPLKHLTGANCNDGLLFVAPTLDKNWKVMELGDGNLHFYDINLFWVDISENLKARLSNWQSKYQ